eukprot:6206174-Pleurochrysis_carterae.AAC.1
MVDRGREGLAARIEDQPGQVAVGRSPNSAKEEGTYLRTTLKRSLALLRTRAHNGGVSGPGGRRKGGRNFFLTHHPPQQKARIGGGGDREGAERADGRRLQRAPRRGGCVGDTSTVHRYGRGATS